MSSVQFVDHEVDSAGLNMTKARIESTVAFTKPGSLKEKLSSVLGLQGTHAQPLPTRAQPERDGSVSKLNRYKNYNMDHRGVTRIRQVEGNGKSYILSTTHGALH